MDFINYIDDSIKSLHEEEVVLKESDRKDEANFKKIQANIFDIAKTYYNVVSKMKVSNFEEEYINRLSILKTVWTQSYDTAKKHNDTEKLVIEELKLGTLKEILSKFSDN